MHFIGDGRKIASMKKDRSPALPLLQLTSPQTLTAVGLPRNPAQTHKTNLPTNLELYYTFLVSSSPSSVKYLLSGLEPGRETKIFFEKNPR
jgi:hypothetical protein